MRERSYQVHEDIWEASQRENSICADSFTVAAAGQLENTETWERKRERKKKTKMENVSQSHGHTLAKSQMSLN